MGVNQYLEERIDRIMKKHVLLALLAGCAVAAAGCGNKQKETEAPKPVEAAAARESEAVKETQAKTAETEAKAAETEKEVKAAETEAKAAETEAKAAETETKAAETEEEVKTAETEAKAAETEEEVKAAETEAEAVETEVKAVETGAVSVETEAEVIAAVSAETETEVYDYDETEPYDYYTAETETEYEVIPMPEYDVSDYLEIKDDKYKNITIQIPAARKATDEEVDEEIANSFMYLEDYDDLVDKKTEGTVKEGDTVNIDYVGTKDGEEFEGGSAEGYDLEIGSGSFIDGFEEGLIGKKIGSEVDLNLTFPEDYGNEDLNGEDVVFHVKINYVAQMPELTDEIAKKLSGDEYDNVNDYVESVRSDIQAGYDEEYKNNAYGQIMNKLSELYPVEEFPDDNVEFYVDNIMRQYIEPYASMYGMSIEDFIAAAYEGLTEDQFREQELIPAAEMNLTQEIILTAIGNAEGITMTDEELDEALQSYADEYGTTIEDITAGTDRETIRSNELQQKVMEWLFENVTIEETAETEAVGAETEAEITAAGTEAETAAETETDIETAVTETE